MKQDEAQRVLDILQPLDQFTGSSDTLNTYRVWHSTWVRLFTQCAQQIAAMVDKPEAEKPEAKLAKVKSEIAKLECQRAEVVRQIGCDTSGSGLDPAEGSSPELEPETDEGELIGGPPDEAAP